MSDYRDRIVLLHPEVDNLTLSDGELIEEISDNIVMLAAGPCTLAKKPGKDNWVDSNGGLPNYICRIARSIHRKRGMPVGRAIAIAVSRVKKWASGTEGPNQRVNADTRAKAVKAVAQWEALKAKARVKRVAKG